MRDKFFDRIAQLSETDDKTLVITANAVYPSLKPFQDKGRLVDVGIAEQNMIGMASGTAKLGFKTFALSSANFGTLRPFEHLRNLPNRYNSDVKVIASGAGFGASPDWGATHFMTDDLGALQSLKNLEIFSPADIPEALAIAKIVTETTGFQCVRLATADPFPIHSDPLTDTEIQQLLNGIPLLIYTNSTATSSGHTNTTTGGTNTKAAISDTDPNNTALSTADSNGKTVTSDTSANNANISSGSNANPKATNIPPNSIADTTEAGTLQASANATIADEVSDVDSVVIFTHGPIAATAIQAAQTVNPNQKIVEVYTCPKLPLNQVAVQQLLAHFNRVITIEEHIKFGGLGTAIAQIIATQNIQIPLEIIGIDDPFTLPVGDLQYLRQAAGLTKENFLAAIFGEDGTAAGK